MEVLTPEQEDAEVKALDEFEATVAAEGHGPEDLAIDGDEQLSFEVGGRSPDKGSFKCSVPLTVEGSFRKGERLSFVVEVQITGVGFDDKLDRQQRVTETVRRHKAQVVGVRRV